MSNLDAYAVDQRLKGLSGTTIGQYRGHLKVIPEFVREPTLAAVKQHLVKRQAQVSAATLHVLVRR